MPIEPLAFLACHQLPLFSCTCSNSPLENDNSLGSSLFAESKNRSLLSSSNMNYKLAYSYVKQSLESNSLNEAIKILYFEKVGSYT